MTHFNRLILHEVAIVLSQIPYYLFQIVAMTTINFSLAGVLPDLSFYVFSAFPSFQLLDELAPLH